MLLLGLLLALGTIMADYTSNYEQNGLSVQRFMQIRPMDSINPNTGIIHSRNGTVIILTVTNNGPSDRQNLTLSEDLSYLPPYIPITYSIRPSSTDGRQAAWNAGDLPAGRRFEVVFSLPVVVDDMAAKSAKPPVTSSAHPPAELSAPTLVDKGQTVSLQLLTPTGLPISGATIQLIMPSGLRVSGVTDANGRYAYSADQSGFYTYGIPDYLVGVIPATESRVPVVVAPPTTGAITPLANNSNSTSQPLFNADQLLGLWPFAGGFLLVGLIAFGLYGYFNRPIIDDRGPTPPAPATRPPVHDGGSASSSGASAYSDAGRSLTSVSSSASASSSAFESGPSSSSKSGESAPAPADESSVIGGSSTSDSDVLSKTRNLIAARRKPEFSTTQQFRESQSRSDSADEETGAYAGKEEGHEKEVESEAYSEAQEAASVRYTEETTMMPERINSPSFSSSSDEGSSGQSGASDGSDASDASDVSERQEGSDNSGSSDVSSNDSDVGAEKYSGATMPITGRPVPAWMTRASPLESESSEVDDEAISKTIAELEALRTELKNRAQARGEGMAKDGEISASPSDYASRRQKSEESYQTLKKLGEKLDSASEFRDLDETIDAQIEENAQAEQDNAEVLNDAGEPEASLEEISESIAPEQPTVSEAAGADEAEYAEMPASESIDKPLRSDESVSDDSASDESSSSSSEPIQPLPEPVPPLSDLSPPSPSARFLSRRAISIAPIPPNVRQKIRRLIKTNETAPRQSGPAKRPVGRPKKKQETKGQKQIRRGPGRPRKN